jgi:hypothetical protein
MAQGVAEDLKAISLDYDDFAKWYCDSPCVYFELIERLRKS